ncbi:MAG: dUTP diphosphatase [Angelakisella sp.]
METMRFKKLCPEAVTPTRATDGSAGYDLSACMEAPITIRHGEVAKIPTGIAIELPAGYAALIFGRSGLGIKHGVVPANAVGLIDSDYRGEIAVGLTCQCEAGYTIQPYERIAQMVIVPVETPKLIETEELDDTARGAGGFGSSGRC